MLFFTRWKAAAIVLTALIVCLFAVPNFFPESVVQRWPSWAQRHIVLGLDLQGGSSLLLQVDTNSVRRERLQALDEDVQAALDKAASSGSGVVWVPMGTYAIGTTLVIGAGTWLLLSPGAVIKRIQHPTSPATLLCNYKAGSAAAAGNIKVTGGMFDAVGGGLTQNCAPLSFVNATNVRIEDLIIKNVANGYSPFVQLFGCHDVWIEDIDFQGGGPSGGRSYQQHPCVRVECTHPTNIPGLVSGDYGGYPNCNNITTRHCGLSAMAASDTQGAFTAWTSMVGTIGVSSGSGFHERIIIVNNVGTGFSQAGFYGQYWDNVVFNSNSMNYPPSPYVMVGGGSSDINIEGNSPPNFPVVPIKSVSGTASETIVFQFTIPANDWNPGTSGYYFSCNGPVSWHCWCYPRPPGIRWCPW